MNTKQIFNIILARIQPSERDYAKESAFVSALIKRMKTALPKGFSIKLTGSVAKKTFLKNSKDIDIFVLAPKKTRKENFEGLVRGIVKKSLRVKPEVRYAEHPYVHITYEGRHVDVVPAYRISSTKDMLSAVDRSVFHTEVVLKRLKANQIQEVLLLKQFLKSNGLYGAEIKIEGFSGYLCELLILKFGTFINVLRYFAKGKKNILSISGKAGKEFSEPLVFIDPVDANRNVAAVVSEENLKRFAKLSGQFLKNPSLRFFEGDFEADELERFKKSKYQKYLVELGKPNVVDDILWGQIKRLARNLESFMFKQDFIVKRIVARSDDKCRIYFSVEKAMLGGWKEIDGPPLKLKEHVKKFLQAHRSSRILRKKGRVSAKVERKVRDAGKAAELFFKDGHAVPSHFANVKIKIKKLVD